MPPPPLLITPLDAAPAALGGGDAKDVMAAGGGMDCNWIVLGAGAIVLGAWLTEELGWGMRDVSMEEEEEGVWPSRGNMRRTWCVGERGRGGGGWRGAGGS